MTTRFIGLKELRANMARVSKNAARKGQRLIVLRKNEPLFELRPLSKVDIEKWNFERDLAEALKESKKGPLYTTEEVLEFIGRKKV